MPQNRLLGALWVAGIIGTSAMCFALPSDIPTVFTEKVSPQAIFDILTYPARVDSKVNANVLSEADGAVSEILKPLGAKVRRGDTIVVIRHVDPVFQYAPLLVVAPVTGVVNQVFITDGSLVNKGDKIVSLTDPNQLRIVIEVAAQDIRSIHRGLKGTLIMPGRADGTENVIAVEVKGLSPSVDPMLGTATCELKIANRQTNFLEPGLVGRVQFKINQRQGILLSDNAVIYHGDETFVRVIAQSVAKSVPVKLGEKRQGRVEILAGLKPGQQVIDRASGFILEGEKVKVEAAHE